jgi:toxin ParE1/3/4
MLKPNNCFGSHGANVTLKVRFTRRAQKDVVEIKDYILRHDKHAADRVRRAIVRAVDALGKHSMMAPESEIPTVRIKLVPPYPNRVYYRVTPDCIQILHVRHTARREPDPSEVI